MQPLNTARDVPIPTTDPRNKNDDYDEELQSRTPTPPSPLIGLEPNHSLNLEPTRLDFERGDTLLGQISDESF